MAWGIVPTSRAEDIEQETSDSLASRWKAQSESLVGLGIDKDRLFSQSLITPSCGTGSLSEALAKRVLALTRDVSAKIRSRFLPS